MTLLSLGSCRGAHEHFSIYNEISINISCAGKNIKKDKSKEKGKDQGSIQSSTTPDQGYLWESENSILCDLLNFLLGGSFLCFCCRLLIFFQKKKKQKKKQFQKHDRVSNGFDPDHDPNCLQRLSADDKNYNYFNPYPANILILKMSTSFYVCCIY